jgi:23S rRNA (uracil1939-C5)-methyltransferase
VVYKKNDLVTVEIEDIGHDGAGIGKVDGFTIFVKDAIIGDIVDARIMKAKTNYAYAKLEKVVTPSSFRVTPECVHHQRCGGCQLQALSYEKQLEYKQNKVRNNLMRIGGFSKEQVDAVMEPIVGMESPFRYRNKAQYPIGYDKSGNLITGFYAGRTHDIIANTDCVLGDERNKEILEAVLLYMKENNVTAYDEKSGTGLVRHVLIRSGYYTGEVMVCVVVNFAGTQGDGSAVSKFLTQQNRPLVFRLCKIPGMTSISININSERTNVIMGKKVYNIWGRETISDKLLGLTFNISPLSFFQVNTLQTEKLYSLALEYAELKGEEIVWDLYCGIGTISLLMATAAKYVYGVEMVPEAVQDARRNAEINGIGNVEFLVGKAEEVSPAVNPDVIVVDPPRKGCDAECLETMIKMQPKRIIYISCDSATLARDLRILCENGYSLTRACTVDQFGQTVHVETVVMLIR